MRGGLFPASAARGDFRGRLGGRSRHSHLEASRRNPEGGQLRRRPLRPGRALPGHDLFRSLGRATLRRRETDLGRRTPGRLGKLGLKIREHTRMETDGILLLSGNEIVDLFRGQEAALMETVGAAYKIKEEGDCDVPNCPFLRFPGNSVDRIIPKTAFLGGQFQAAGIKWIASFPANLGKGLERASAVLILNSTETGLPLAIMEGSVISACRTAASAALAATTLRGKLPATAVGILGCGLINF